MRSLSPCSVPGCPELTRAGRCTGHRQAAERDRGTAAERGYDGRWRRTRRAFLRTHPLCQDPQGCFDIATEVHHKDGLGPLGPRGHDPENLQALCKAHHSAITALEQPGGWAR